MREFLKQAQDSLTKKDDTNFEKRIQNPVSSIQNKDGTSSTHKMLSFEADGKYYAAPKIVERDGKLVELDEGDAINYALKTGEYKEFKTEAEAQKYAEGGYKKGTPMETQEQSVDQPELTSDDKLLTIVQDFYKASGKDLSEQRAKQITEYYKGNYEKVVSDLYKAAGKEVTPERIKSIKKYYKLVEDAPTQELPKDVIDYNAKLDEVDSVIDNYENITKSIGGLGPGARPPSNIEEIKNKKISEANSQKEAINNSFNFKPITLKEVVNTLGKGKDDIDEVSQTSKLYLEKYTKRMQESLEHYEKTLSPIVKDIVDKVKNGKKVDINTPIDADYVINEGDMEQYEEWKRRASVLSQQEELNKSTIYKKDEIKRKINNAAREAKDNNQSVKDAILKVMEEEGVMTEEGRDLATRVDAEGNTAGFDTWVGTSSYNTVKRIHNTLKSTWRGIKEAFDGWDEKSTTYNEAFMKEFDKYLDKEVDEDIKKLMWGTNKSKYDGDIREKRVDVDGVKVILDDKGEAVGVRRPDGNMAWNFKDNEISAIQKYEANKDELKNEVYHDFRVGTLGAKGTQVMTDMIPIIAATAATGGIGGTALGTYAVTYGDFYDQQFEKTGSVGNATAFASAATAMTAMLEGLGGIEGSIIRNASKKSLNNAITDAAAEVASKNIIDGKTVTSVFMKHLGNQMLEETGIELAQSLGEAATELVFNGDTEISLKELEEIIILTPFATGPISGVMSANSFKNFGIENIKIAAKKKDVFNRLVDEWVGAAKTDEQREQRQKEADFKKGVVEELSQSLVAVDELGVIAPEITKNLLDKSVEIVQKKQQIAKTKSDQARGVYENDLAKLQSEVQALVQEGYDEKLEIDKQIEQSQKEIAERDARIAERKKEEAAKARQEEREVKAKELDEVKNDPEFQRLNITPDNDKEVTRKHSLPTVADFDAMYTDGVSDSGINFGQTLKIGKLPEEPNEQGEQFTDAVVVDNEGNTKAQFTVYGNTPVTGAVELDAVVDEDLRRTGVSTRVYQEIANNTGKPIIPASVSRDFSTEKTGSTLSKSSALFWKSLHDKGIAEEVEVTTKDGKVIRTLAILPEGFTSTDTVKKIEDSGVEDSNVESEKFEQEDTVETDMANGTFVLNRKGTPITYKIVKFNTNKKTGEITSVEATDPTGKKKVIRAKGIVAELIREKIIHENKLIENEIQTDELIRATTESGARTSEQLSSDRTGEDTGAVSEEQKFREGTRDDILKQSVNYQGVQGKLLRDEDGTYYVLTPDGDTLLVEGGESTATNKELGITKGKTEVELLEDKLDEKKADRASIRQQMYDLFFEIDKKIPRDAVGAFVDVINSGGGNVTTVAKQLTEALQHRISKPIADAIGEPLLKSARELSKKLDKLNNELSTKNVRKLRKDARIMDAKTEAKQIRAERKAKEIAARKRAAQTTLTPETANPKSIAGGIFSLRALADKLKKRFGIPTRILSKEDALKEIQKKYPRLMFAKNGGVAGEDINLKDLKKASRDTRKKIKKLADKIGFKVANTKNKSYSVYFDSLVGVIYINDLYNFDYDIFYSSIESYYGVTSFDELIKKIETNKVPEHSIGFASDNVPDSFTPNDLSIEVIEKLINLGKINWTQVSYNPSITMEIVNKYYDYLDPEFLVSNPSIPFDEAVKILDKSGRWIELGIRLATRPDFTIDKLPILIEKLGFGSPKSFIEWAFKQNRIEFGFHVIYQNPILLDLVLEHGDSYFIDYTEILTVALSKELYLKHKKRINEGFERLFGTEDSEWSLWVHPDTDLFILKEIGFLKNNNHLHIRNFEHTKILTDGDRFLILKLSKDINNWNSLPINNEMLYPILSLPHTNEQFERLSQNPSVNPEKLIMAIKEYLDSQMALLESSKGLDKDYVLQAGKYKWEAAKKIITVLKENPHVTLELILEHKDIFKSDDVLNKILEWSEWDKEEKARVLDYFWEDIKGKLDSRDLFFLFDSASSGVIFDYLTLPVSKNTIGNRLIPLSDVKLPKNTKVSHIFPLFTSKSIEDIVKYWIDLWTKGESTIESATTMGPNRGMERLRTGQARIVFNNETTNFTAYSPYDNYSVSVPTSHEKLIRVKTATRSSVHTDPSKISELLHEGIDKSHDEWLIRLTPGSIDYIEYSGSFSTLPENLKLLNEVFGIKIKVTDITGQTVRILHGVTDMLFAQRANDGSVRGYFDRVAGEAVLVDGEANPTTTIHEAFSHPFVEKVRTENPKLYNKLLAEAKGLKDVVKAVDSVYKESTHEDKDAEYITHAIDKYVNNELDATKNKTLIEAIEEFFKYVSKELKKILNIDTTVGELSPNLTLQDLALYALYGEGKIDLRPTKSTIETKTEPAKEEQPKKESTDIVDDTVWNTYVNTGIVPDSTLQGIADHIQNGTGSKMSERQFAIFNNKTAEVNRILSQRDAEGSYPRKSAAKATEDAISIIERRNNQIGRVLKSLGFTQDKINDTITVFGQVAKRWAKRNNRPIEDFYSDVFKGIEVAELGVGRRGRTIPLDGGYIVQLTHEATVATPIHELAHIFQNFLTKAEQQFVLEWLGHDKWTRETSEGFAKGFEKWLMDSEDVPDLDAFKRFKEWLTDIYDGIISYAGSVLPTFSPDVKRLYTSILTSDVETHTQQAYNAAVGKNNTMLDRMRKEGLQFKKAVFDDVLRKVEVTARGLNRFDYMPRKMKRLAEQAVKKGFTDPIVALRYATDQMASMTEDPDYLPSMSVEEAIGYGYALTQMEAAYERVVNRRKKYPKNKDLLELQDELSRGIQDLAQVLTIARSHAGLQLRIGSHRFTHDLFSPEVMKLQVINKLGRKLTGTEEAEIERQSKYIQASMKQYKEAADNLDEATREELRSMAEQLVSEQFKNSPFMREALKQSKAKTPRQRSVDLKKEFEKINKILSDKPDMLLDEKETNLYDEDTDDTIFFRSMRNFISLLMAYDESIDSFEKLADAMQEYWPNINQDKLLSVIVWSDPAYQKARAEALVSTASIIKKESRLLDKLRTYLTESYKDIEKTGNKKIFPARLQELEKLITQLQTLAATDYTIDNETFTEAIIHLDSLQSIYAGLALEKVTFESPTLEDMISKVREYETARKLSRREKQLKELEGIIEQLNNGTYEGSLSDLVPENPQKYVDERLEQIANKIGVSKEVIKTYKDKSNKLEIIKRIGSLLQRDDKGESIRDFRTIYYNIKAELPEVTEREVYEAILYKADPKKIGELLKSARSNMVAEVKAIEKLENFLKKPPKKSKTTDTRTVLQAELKKLTQDIEELAAVRYENLSDYKIDELKSKFKDIVNNYTGILSGDITTMTIEDIIKEVEKIKDAELTESLKEGINKSRIALDKTLAGINIETNIFELVPELLPKVISENNQRLKRILSDNIKHERLLRINKMFSLVKDLVSSGSELSATELKAITKFLEIEKKSKDMKPELIRLNRQVYLQRAAFNDWLEAKYTATNTARFKALVNTPRVLTLAADISFVMYQGGNMLFSHPIIASKSFGKMVLAAFNHKVWQQQLADLQLNPFYTIAIASGLKLVDETSLTLEEELQLTSILERWFLTKGISKMLRRFGERIYSSYMNHLRIGTFVEGLKALNKTNSNYIGDEEFYGSDEGFTQEHRDVVKKLAAHINMHTGSANTFTGHEGFDEGINALLDSASGIFIAPRLYASVFRSTLAMTGMPDAAKLFSMRKEPSENNLMKSFYKYRLWNNLRILGGLVGFHAVMLATFSGVLKGLGGDDEEMEKFMQTQLNPYSSEFLKVKSGQRVFAISPYVSYYRFMARLAFQGFVNDGLMEDSFEMTPTMKKKTGFVDHTYDFMRYRWNPIVGGLIDAGILNRDWDNKPISKYSLFSEDFGWAALDRGAAIVKKSTIPIWGQGIWDNFERKTYNQIAAELAIDFTGINAYTVEPYQDTEVRNYLRDNKFRLSYDKIPKSINRPDDIKADVKMEFGEWLKSEITNGRKPTKKQMQIKNSQIVRQLVREAQR